MIAYLSKQDLYWDLTCEDGSRYKAWWVRDYKGERALEKVRESFPHYEIELVTDFKDQGYNMAKRQYEYATGFPYDGRCE